MRHVSLFLLALSAHAQISLVGKPVGSILNYYETHPTLQGDTNYCVQTAATYHVGGSAGTSTLNLNDGIGNRTISGKIFCTFNDGISPAGNSNIGLYNLTVLDMGSAANTTAVALNAMTSFGIQGEENLPAGWASQRTTGVVTGGTGADWKSSPPISVSGWIVLPVQRQDKTPYYATGDSTLVASPDGGAHWCNPYTYASHSGSPGCDSANWQADGDAPKAPSDGSYTASPSSIMWKDITPFDGSSNRMGRLYFFDYCQDQACTGMPNGADSYVYGFGGTGRSTKSILFRVPKNIGSIMNVATWEYFSCATYSTATPCNGMDNANWTTTLASATIMFSNQAAAHNGSGTPTVETPNGLTGQMGAIFGPPTYYCANGGCAYVMTTYQRYLAGSYNGQTNHDRNAIAAFPSPWGPFTPITSEAGTIIGGFWTILKYTLSTTDSSPYSTRFVMAGNNNTAPFNTVNSSVGFQAYDLKLGANQHGTSLAGCSQYRFTSAPAASSIIRRGLWGFFDFFSHGCYNHRVGDLYYPSFFANDISTYPSSKQLIGCFTDAGVKCANENPGHGMQFITLGLYLGNNGYGARFELTDMAPGIYNRITASPLTASTDPLFTVGFVFEPVNVSETLRGIMEVGAAQPNSTLIYAGIGVAGNVCIVWGYPTRICTTAAVMANNTPVSIMVSRTATGAPTACAALPCTSNTPIYVDGVQVTTSLIGGGTGPNVTAGPHTFGFIAGANTMSAVWYALEIYSRALSPAEVSHNYKSHKERLLASRGISLP